jgi:hypothetical protein
MKFTVENRSTRGKTSPSATLSTTNPTSTDAGSNPDLRSERPATNRLSHDMMKVVLPVRTTNRNRRQHGECGWWLSLCASLMHMEGVQVQLHSFLNSALDTSESSGPFLGVIDCYPLNRRQGEPQTPERLCSREKSLAFATNRTSVPRPSSL